VIVTDDTVLGLGGAPEAGVTFIAEVREEARR
jgi:hypothetical protein